MIRTRHERGETLGCPHRALILLPDGRNRLAVACGWTRPVTARLDRAVVDSTRPVAAAVEAHMRLERSEHRCQALQEAVDRMAAGAIVVEDGTRVVALNREACRLVELTTGLEIVDGRIRIADQRVMDDLRLATAAHDGVAPAVALRLEATDPPLHLVVAPGAVDVARVLLLTPASCSRRPDPGHLAALFGLTPAETRVVMQLLGGGTLTAAAEALHITRNTAHTHLRSVFAKTGVSSQHELVALLLTGVAGIHREPTRSHRPVASPDR